MTYIADSEFLKRVTSNKGLKTITIIGNGPYHCNTNDEMIEWTE